MLYVANIIKDQKFIDGQIAYHDLTADLCQHEYYILSWDYLVELKYIEKKERVQGITPDELLEKLYTRKYDAIFIHNFNAMPLHYMRYIPLSVKVFWFAWGYDLYNTPQNSPYIKIDLLHKESKQCLANLRKKQRNVPIMTRIKREVKYLLQKQFCYKKLYHNDDPKVYKEAVKRVDYFAGVFPLEYDLLKIHPEFHAIRVSYEYTNPIDWKSFSSELPAIGNNILIGNSADINNNHLDILDYLKNVNMVSRKLIVPLSYGGSEEYTKIVAKAYKDSFGEGCITLTDFMPREKYFELLSSVGIAIFFHERQQATCNIEELLRHGVKVFLSETSVNYEHYKSLGYYVYSLQSDFNQQSLLVPLTKEQKLYNARTWYKTSNREYRLQYLYDIYNILEKQRK